MATLSFLGGGKSLTTAADVAHIVSAIDGAEELVSFALGGSSMGQEALEAVAAALAKKTTLKTAHFADIFTARKTEEIPVALAAIGAALLKQTGLEEADFSDNAVSLGGAKALVPFLANCTSLKTLRLNNTGVGKHGGSIVGKALLAGAAKGLRLETFVLGRSRLEILGARSVAAALKEMKSLRHVSMPQNGIRHRGITPLAEALAESKDLVHLDLNDNIFTEKGGASMAKTLAILENLRELNLGDCLLRAKGAKVVLQSLKNATLLERVDLVYNEMPSALTDDIVEFVKNKSNLKEGGLSLNGNAINEDSVEKIRAALAEAGVENALGETDEMEEEEEEDEKESGDEDKEEEEESSDEEEEEEDASADDISSLLGGLAL